MPTLKDVNELNEREVVELKGHVDSSGYFPFPLPGRRMTVSVRGMSGDEENLFHKDSRRNPIAPFIAAVAACVKEQVDIKRMLLDDFMSILFIMRRLTYGDFFTFRTPCPHCGSQLQIEEDLATTKFVYSSRKDTEILDLANLEPSWNCTLPLSKRVINYTLPCAGGQEVLWKISKDHPESVKTKQIQTCVLRCDGKPMFDSEWSEIPAFDLRFLEKQITKHSTGPITTIEATCAKCSSMLEIEMPIGGADFLLAPINPRMRPEKDMDGLLSTLWASRVANVSGMKSSSLDSELTELD